VDLNPAVSLRFPKRARRLVVLFREKDKLGVGDVRDIQERLADMLPEKPRHCLAVVPGTQTPAAKKAIAKLLQEEKTTVEVFTCLELCLNVLEHDLVPKHELLTEDEKLGVMRDYNVTAEQIPRIRTTDPPMRWLGVTKNTLVKITRKSDDDAEGYITYRMAVGQ
jgi:DNA-directed RNA polymerases I, II, and III subunit RPABC1